LRFVLICRKQTFFSAPRPLEIHEHDCSVSRTDTAGGEALLPEDGILRNGGRNCRTQVPDVERGKTDGFLEAALRLEGPARGAARGQRTGTGTGKMTGAAGGRTNGRPRSRWSGAWIKGVRRVALVPRLLWVYWAAQQSGVTQPTRKRRPAPPLGPAASLPQLTGLEMEN